MRRAKRFVSVLGLAVLLPGLGAARSTTTAPLREGEGLRSVDPRAFALLEDPATAWEAALGALERRAARRTPADLLADANREGRRQYFVMGVAPWKLHVAFGWNEGDSVTHDWYPQGITGLRTGGRKAVVVSWYQRADGGDGTGPKGVRVSFADVTDMDHVRYRHALLVEPVLVRGRADVRAVRVHAGGIALYGRWLYVADTSRGFRVFDTARILEADTSADERLGVDPATGRIAAYGYKYVVPQVGAYTLTTWSSPARFSSVSIDRSTTPDTLVTCEYRRSDIEGRVFRWALDEATGELAARAGCVRPVQAFVTAQDRVQGALAWNGTWFLSCSSQHGGWGALYTTGPGRPSRDHSWAAGAESLHYSQASGNLWSLSEHPGERSVFAVKLADYD